MPLFIKIINQHGGTTCLIFVRYYKNILEQYSKQKQIFVAIIEYYWIVPIYSYGQEMVSVFFTIKIVGLNIPFRHIFCLFDITLHYHAV